MASRSINFNFLYDFSNVLTIGESEVHVLKRENSLLPTESGPGRRIHDDQLRSGERDRFHQTIHESRYRNSV